MQHKRALRSTAPPSRATSLVVRTPPRGSRRRPRLPLPIALVLAVGTVLAERIQLGRRGRYPIVAGSLLLCVLLSGFGRARFAGHVGGVGLSPTPSVHAAGDDHGGDPYPAGAGLITPAQPHAATSIPSPTSTAAPTGTAARPSLGRTHEPPAAAGTPQPTTPPAPPTAVPPTPTLTAQQATPRGTTVIPILMYHYVRVVTNPKDTLGINLSVKPDLFAAQMQYLADNGYTTLTMSEVHARAPLPLARRPTDVRIAARV